MASAVLTLYSPKILYAKSFLERLSPGIHSVNGRHLMKRSLDYVLQCSPVTASTTEESKIWAKCGLLSTNRLRTAPAIKGCNPTICQTSKGSFQSSTTSTADRFEKSKTHQPKVPISPSKAKSYSPPSPPHNPNAYRPPSEPSLWEIYKAEIAVGGAIGLCCVTYGVMQYAWFRESSRNDSKLLVWMYGNFVCTSENIRARRWWVKLTSSIQHAGLLHLGINMYFFWSFGPGFVSLLGISSFLSLWVISAWCGSTASLAWLQRQETIQAERQSSTWSNERDQDEKRWFAPRLPPGEELPRGTVGSSTAIYGLSAAVMCVAPKLPTQIMFIPIPFSLWQMLGAITAGSLYCLNSGVLSELDHAGHLGGLFGGISTYYTVIKPWLRRLP